MQEYDGWSEVVGVGARRTGGASGEDRLISCLVLARSADNIAAAAPPRLGLVRLHLLVSDTSYR